MVKCGRKGGSVTRVAGCVGVSVGMGVGVDGR